MCLAIYKPAGVTIDQQHLSNGFENNSHGAGFAVVQEDGTVLICKGFFKFEPFIQAYLLHSLNQARQAIIHFRWATHGETNAFNCHPWPLGDTTPVTLPGVPLAMTAPAAMIHNGVLSHRSDAERSDTGYYVLDILDPLFRKFPNFIGDPVISHLVADHIGAYNKFVIMGGDGAYSIVNHKAGTSDQGSWYSNCDFRTSRYRGVTGWGYDDDDFVGGRWGGRKSSAAQAAPVVDAQDLVTESEAIGSVSIFPDEQLLPHEMDELNRLCITFPEVVAEFEDAEAVFAFFKGARSAYRRMNPSAAKLTQAEVDTLMQNESFVESLMAASHVFPT